MAIGNASVGHDESPPSERVGRPSSGVPEEGAGSVLRKETRTEIPSGVFARRAGADDFSLDQWRRGLESSTAVSLKSFYLRSWDASVETGIWYDMSRGHVVTLAITALKFLQRVEDSGTQSAVTLTNTRALSTANTVGRPNTLCPARHDH